MPRFRYTSIDESGREASGKREAESGDALRALLESEGHRVETVERVEPDNANETTGPVVDLNNKDFASLSESITSVTTAGLPLESGLRALSEEIPSGRMRSTLRAIVAWRTIRANRGRKHSRCAAAVAGCHSCRLGNGAAGYRSGSLVGTHTTIQRSTANHSERTDLLVGADVDGAACGFLSRVRDSRI